MNPQLVIVGGLINAALYLAGCFAAGLAHGNPWVWKGAILSAGLAYIAYVLVHAGATTIGQAISLASVAVAIVIGLALLAA